MFSFLKELPNKIEFKGVTYNVDMSFDNILLLYKMLNDNRLIDGAKIVTGLKMLIPDIELEGRQDLVDFWNHLFLTLISNDKENDEIQYDIKGNPMPRVKEDGEDEALVDFYQDAEYIFASFLQDYGIDLHEQRGKMHWYKFLALFNGLSDSTRMRKVIEIRTMPLPKGKGTAEQRRQVEKLKRHYQLKKGDEVIGS